jgi:hypothetical protein
MSASEGPVCSNRFSSGYRWTASGSIGPNCPSRLMTRCGAPVPPGQNGMIAQQVSLLRKPTLTPAPIADLTWSYISSP